MDFFPVRRNNPMQFHKLRLFKILKWGGDDSSAGKLDAREEVTSLDQADVVSSEFRDRKTFGPNFEESTVHMVVLDIDVPAVLIPSSTPGHSHLYIETLMCWEEYLDLLNSMARCGILEPGYVAASEARGFTCVRLPWVRK